MTVRGTLLALALAVAAAPAVAQQREVADQDIQELQQQLAALAAVRNLKPEDAQKLLDQFQRWQQNGGKGNWGEFLKQNPLPKPPVQPPPPVVQPPPMPLPDVPRPPVPPPDFPPPPPFEAPRPDVNPFKNANPPPPGNNPDAQGLMDLWEQHIGNLDDTPAVRDAILDLFRAGENGDFAGGDWKNLLDEFNRNGGNNAEFGDWLKEMNLQGEKWDFGDLGGGWDLPRWNWGGGWGGGGGGGGGGVDAGGGWNWGGGGGGFSGGGGGGSWLPVVLLVVFAAGALIAWKLWPLLANRESAAAQAVRAINNWPVDPRTIATREELVKAFEYLSVLLCGDAARVWNHETIARALRQQIPASELVADELAKLYELARYTPAGEPLPASALADARRCLCHLAGVRA